MNKFSVTAILIFSILTTVNWGFRKKLLHKKPLVHFILLETIFVSTIIISVCYYYLGSKTVLNIPNEVDAKYLLFLLANSMLISGSIFLMLYLIKHEDISHLYPIIGGLNILIVVLIGICLLGEKLSIKKLFSISLISLGLFTLLNGTSE